MLRMAHRILSQGCKTTPEMTASCVNICKSLEKSQSLIVDNCAESVFDSQLNDDRYLDPRTLPSIKSPFDFMFVEYNVPKSYVKMASQEKTNWSKDVESQKNPQHGVFISQIEHSTLSKIISEAGDRPEIRKMSEYEIAKDMYDIGGHTAMRISIFVSHNGIVGMIPAEWIMAIDSDGKLGFNGQIIMKSNRLDNEEGISCFSNVMSPVFFALAMCHCKNVEMRDATESHGPNAKWKNRLRVPDIKYRILEIEPAKKILRESGKSDEVGLAKALHICRGHFATYTEDKPLFGHTVGTVWKSSHVRGDIKAGAVVKDYSISLPVTQ